MPLQTPAQPGYKHSSGEVTPIWELVHRGTPDLAASWKDAGRNLAVDTTMPKVWPERGSWSTVSRRNVDIC